MGIQKPVQRSGVEVANAPADVVSKWLHDGELTDLMNGRDPGKLKPVSHSVVASGVPDPAPDPPANDPDLGAMGPPRPDTSQLDAAQLRRLSPEQIVAARKAGRLDKLLGIQLR